MEAKRRRNFSVLVHKGQRNKKIYIKGKIKYDDYKNQLKTRKFEK